MKVTIIGAGNVGATVALSLAQRDFLKEIVLVDIKSGVAEGKGLDIWQCAPVHGFSTRVVGVTDDYQATAGSDLVVITSGVPRKPGMSRDDLIEVNARIVKSVAERSVKYSPEAIFLVVSNPLDVMTYCTWKATGIPHHRVFGMAGVLDTARFRAFIAEALNCSPKDIQTMILGGHGDTMVPLPRYTTVSGIPITELLDKETIDRLVERTRYGGGEIVNLLGTSAWYAPGVSVAQMVEAILKDEKRILPCCVWLSGEYGLKDIYIGVPAKLGRAGVEQVIELQLTEEERQQLYRSAEHVREVMAVLDRLNLF